MIVVEVDYPAIRFLSFFSAMRMRGEVFTEVRTAKFVFIPIKSQLERHRNLWFGPKDNFIGGFPNCVVDTCVVGEWNLRC